MVRLAEIIEAHEFYKMLHNLKQFQNSISGWNNFIFISHVATVQGTRKTHGCHAWGQLWLDSPSDINNDSHWSHLEWELHLLSSPWFLAVHCLTTRPWLLWVCDWHWRTSTLRSITVSQPLYCSSEGKFTPRTTFVTITLELPKTEQHAFTTFPKYVWATKCYAYRWYTTFQKSNMAAQNRKYASHWLLFVAHIISQFQGTQ